MNTFTNFQLLNIFGFENILFCIALICTLLCSLSIKIDKAKAIPCLVLSFVFYSCSYFYSYSLVSGRTIEQYDEYVQYQQSQDQQFHDFLVLKKKAMMADGRISESEMRQVRRIIFIYHHLVQFFNHDEKYNELLELVQDIRKDDEISYLDVVRFKKLYDKNFNKYIDEKHKLF